jgi:hypothetical protein
MCAPCLCIFWAVRALVHSAVSTALWTTCTLTILAVGAIAGSIYLTTTATIGVMTCLIICFVALAAIVSVVTSVNGARTDTEIQPPSHSSSVPARPV